ncbi:MAG: NAD(P)/FAD-dependent oxidoreductase [Bdellovibrionota bacterium]
MNTDKTECDVLIVGGSFAAAACAKRLTDAGMHAIILEKKALPRHKICSGILSPRGKRFLEENFGTIPTEALHEPHTCNGVVFHFPSLNQMKMDFIGGATPHLYRKYSDQWALKQSGATIHDQCSFESFTETSKGVEVSAQDHKTNQKRSYSARWLVGADGPSSPVLRAVYGNSYKLAPMFFVGQKFHKIIDCPLDPQYFHFWFHPELGKYVWSHARDGQQIVGVGFEVGQNFDQAHLKVKDYLEDKHGVKLEEATHEQSEGCMENFGPSLINQYVFGKGRVLLTGQAAGFLNMLAEGMSCALHSGAIAGESIVEANLKNKAVEAKYRELIHSEVKRCSDQWNPLMIAFKNPHEANPKKELAALGAPKALQVLKEIWTFLKTYKDYKWGRQMLKISLYRLIKGRYPESSWR